MVLHRGRGPGDRVAALAPVGHLPVHTPNRADVLNPHPARTRPTARGLAAYNGCAPELLLCRALWRRVHRASRESSWLLPDGQQGRPTEGRDFFRDRSRVSLPRETLGAWMRATVLRGWSRPWSRRIARPGKSRMPGTLIQGLPQCFRRDSNCCHGWATRQPETDPRTTGCANKINRHHRVRGVYREQMRHRLS